MTHQVRFSTMSTTQESMFLGLIIDLCT